MYYCANVETLRVKYAQQTCTNAVIAHQHGMWEGDLLHYCIDYDCDINLESTLSPKGTACLHAMITTETDK